MNKNDYQEESMDELFLLKNQVMKKVQSLRTTNPSRGVMLRFLSNFVSILYIYTLFPFSKTLLT
jgi:hypothetical protein